MAEETRAEFNARRAQEYVDSLQHELTGYERLKNRERIADVTAELAAAKEQAAKLAAATRKTAAEDGEDVTPTGATSTPQEIRDPGYEKLKLEQLKTLAAERGLDATAFSVKADYVDALVKADEPPKEPGDSGDAGGQDQPPQA
ncbi:MAG TPA: hypothetical protein VGC45_15740 [Gryllotalpicola sp.]